MKNPSIFLLQLLAGLSIVTSFPQHRPAKLYDDRTGISYDHDYLASMVNQDLGLVPRVEFIGHNNQPSSPQPVMEKRMLEELKEKKKRKKPPGRQPSHTMGPWIRYSQTYWNPFIYGGPGGSPPVFVPALGVWPL